VTEKMILEVFSNLNGSMKSHSFQFPKALMFPENNRQIQKPGTVSLQYRRLFQFFRSTGSCIQEHKMVKYIYLTW